MKYAIAFCAIQDSWIDGGHTFVVLLSQCWSPQYDHFYWQVESSFGFNPTPQGWHGSLKNYFGSIAGYELWGHIVTDKSKMFGSSNIRCNLYPITESKFLELKSYIANKALHPNRFSSSAPAPDLSNHSLPDMSCSYSCVSFAMKIVHYAINEKNLLSLPPTPCYFGIRTKNIPRTYWWHALQCSVRFMFYPSQGVYLCSFTPKPCRQNFFITKSE